eukprot:COSAG01_NODE_17_length_39991_cov_30.596160_34_plen_75_part_00
MTILNSRVPAGQGALRRVGSGQLLTDQEVYRSSVSANRHWRRAAVVDVSGCMRAAAATPRPCPNVPPNCAYVGR